MSSAASLTRASAALDRPGDLSAHQTAGLPSASAPAILGNAARAIKARWAAAATIPREADHAVHDLAVLCEAAFAGLSGAPIPSFAAHTWTAAGPRVLTALRREILDQPAASSPPATEVLRVLRQLERLAQELEQNPSSQFGGEVLGPNALQLLVEIGHDMRSPLTSIQFLVERMRRGQTGPVSPMQERHLDLVYSAAFGLSALTSDVMELAQGGARLVGPAVVPFSIGEVLRAVRDVVQPIAEEKKLMLRFSGPPNDVRLGHPAALHRVLLNLVTNALKFTYAGAVTVQADAVSQNEVRFLVADTGRGMPASVTARLADGFVPPNVQYRLQSDREEETAFSSAGLGLAICQTLVSAMDGRLTLLSTDSRGSKLDFTLDLPLLPSDSSEVQSRAS